MEPRLAEASRRLLPAAWLKPLLPLDPLVRLYEDVRQKRRPLFESVLEEMGITIECEQADLERIPKSGAVVVVANHPYGLLEGPVLGHLLMKRRADVRFLANSLLSAVPELEPYVIPVDPFGGSSATRANLAPLRRALEWLKGGGLLVVFPAGEVSALRMGRWRVEDGSWNPAAARLIAATGASAAPIFVHGTNGAAFQVAGLLHPKLRTALLPRQLLNKRGARIRVSIGHPIGAGRLKGLRPEEATAYLRQRTVALAWRRSAPAWRQKASPVEVAAARRPELARGEIEALGPDAVLARSGEFEVYLAEAHQIPNGLHEIGRLRELTFRAAGEGTGKPIDLDRYDSYYQHLFLWNREKGEIAGAYRLAATDEVLRRMGMTGLYTASLFRLHAELFRRLGPALELGRSFVRAEYQRSYQPLLLLWKGIGAYVARRPQYRYLFGPVSISGDYAPAARQLMVAFLQRQCQEPKLKRFVRPRRGLLVWQGAGVRQVAALLQTPEDLSELVADLDVAGRPLPVLVRQYLNVGGRFLAFSVDPAFSGVVDGLVLVDLMRTNEKLLQRYLGPGGAARFLAWHRAAG